MRSLWKLSNRPNRKRQNLSALSLNDASAALSTASALGLDVPAPSGTTVYMASIDCLPNDVETTSHWVVGIFRTQEAAEHALIVEAREIIREEHLGFFRDKNETIPWKDFATTASDDEIRNNFYGTHLVSGFYQNSVTRTIVR